MDLYTAILSENLCYTGRELAPHWIAKQTRHFGSSVVAFRGGCTVQTSELVDMEDQQDEEKIIAKEMLHFLGEWFEGDLLTAIYRQRLWIAAFAEELRKQLPSEYAIQLVREGNDLYLGSFEEKRKLSVSIVTASPVSTLFHFGVNIDATGAPVKAIGLKDLKVDVPALASSTLERWKVEWGGVRKARCKVAPR